MGRLFLFIMRIVIGLVVVKTGLDIARHEHIIMNYTAFESFISAVFIIAIGLHIVFSSIRNQFFQNQ